MLFNSPEFLFAFLPVVLAVYYWLGNRGGAAANPLPLYWLIAASLFFYGWWNPAYLLLIGLSIMGNFSVGRAIQSAQGRTRRVLLIAGITLNLASIGYFKYANFILDNINALWSTSLSVGEIVLPLAISFFTFQQIAFLVDTYRGEVEEADFTRYGLFVVFFPQLIAGPIVHHREMMPQFQEPVTTKCIGDRLNRGTTLFAIGLFKKIVIADSLAQLADPVFALADTGQDVSLIDAWIAALAYTFQLYFDFSGYSDMALGLAIMFGISLPLNFYSPYKARNIIEFWRRWNMTLSRFLRDYVYIALGGNRRGKSRRYTNLLLTMLIGGVWHGAGWSFVLWGALHGTYLMINHGWRAMLAQTSIGPLLLLNRLLAPAITFLAVVIAWVYFRATTLEGANLLLISMFGQGNAALDASGIQTYVANYPLNLLLQPFVESSAAFSIGILLAFSAGIAFCLPNSVEFMGREHPALQATIPVSDVTKPRWLQWQPSARWAIATALLLFISLLSAKQLTPFLYFQF